MAGGRDLEVLRCRGCGHGCVWPPLPSDVLAGIYDSQAYYQGGAAGTGFADYESLGAARRRMFNRHLSDLESRVRPGRILDVGCATGDFLRVAEARGWTGLGVDPSAAAKDAARSGTRLVGRTIQDAEIAPGSLDVVSFWDVLEHLVNPRQDLVRARSLLRRGGLVVLTVPAADNLTARLTGRHWFGYAKLGEHVQFFGAASLALALSRSGFVPVVIRPVRWTCSLGFLGDRATQYLAPVGRAAGAVLGSPWLATRVVDVPQINRYAVGVATALTGSRPLPADTRSSARGQRSPPGPRPE